MTLYGKIASILTDARREQLAGLQPRAADLADGANARPGDGPGD